MTRVLDPGAYDNVVVNSRATLRLSPGTYHLSSLTLEPDATLALNKISGPIVIYVSGMVLFKGKIQNEGGPEGNFLLVALGDQGVYIEKAFTGTIVAPNTKITLATISTDYRGTFYAKDIEIHPNSQIVAVPFDWYRPHGNCVQYGCSDPGPCHKEGVCDQETGVCNYPIMEDGVGCSDQNACTKMDICKAGTCVGKEAVVCVASDKCHSIGTCDIQNGLCSNPEKDSVGCNVSLRNDGVVDLGGGKYVAIFGYSSQAAKAFHPQANQVYINGALVSNPQLFPPMNLLPGDHPGGYLPTFQAGETIEWKIDGISVAASKDSPKIPYSTGESGGISVLVGNSIVTINPEFGLFEKIPNNPPVTEFIETKDDYKPSLSGQLSISQTGSATYTVPIAIPPGIAGMAPNLSLIYDSQGRDGIAGQGWNLSGTSVIHRCSKTKAQDGYVRPILSNGTTDIEPVTSESGDGVCLDGIRLFLRGSDGGETVFESETADFSRITLDAMGKTFKVVTKTGETRFFGSSDLTRITDGDIIGAPPYCPNGVCFINVWAMDKVQDVWGNYYTLTYNNNVKSTIKEKGLLLTKIDYTGHVGGEGKIARVPFYSINFTYSPREDVRNTRFGDVVLAMNHRLTSIGTPRGRYMLTYEKSELTLPSRLKQIELCEAISFDPAKYYEEPITCNKQLTLPLTFDWDAGDDGWQNAPGYALPTNIRGVGTQFVDLDGDGRLDFVLAREGEESRVWRNMGMDQSTSWLYLSGSWEEKPAWVLPIKLASIESQVLGTYKPTGTIFADLNGDGMPDLISDNYSISQSSKPTIWINRIRENGGWQEDIALSGNAITEALPETNYKIQLRSEKTKINGPNTDKVIDVDNDGFVDLMHISITCEGFDVFPYTNPSKGKKVVWVLRNNNGTSWSYSPEYSREATFSPCSSIVGEAEVQDINRDGLPDITGLINWVNTGNASKGYGDTVWKNSLIIPEEKKLGTISADIDGDGLYDRIIPGDITQTDLAKQKDHKIKFSNGMDWITNYTQPYVKILKDSTFGTLLQYANQGENAEGRFKVADLNADGLSDIVVNNINGGRWLVNQGYTWVDRDVFTEPTPIFPYGIHYVPTGTAPRNMDNIFDAFIDLDGDGLQDRIQTYTHSGQTGRYAWRNKFRIPIINGFPNGIAKKTKITYAVITTAEAQAAGIYKDENILASGLKYLITPLRVVSNLDADNGIGGIVTTAYKYHDLRASKSARGIQGFRKVTATTPDGIVTTTTYSQNFPYTGKILSVLKEKNGKISETFTTYIPNLPDQPKVSVFVYPQEIKNVSYLRNTDNTRSETITSVTKNNLDKYGNLGETTITLTSSEDSDIYETKTSNKYGAEDSLEQKRGKVTETIVSSKKISANGEIISRTHKVKYEYLSTNAMPLTKKIIEPGAGVGVEEHNVYKYDQFGNLVISTSCVSDFEQCEPGEVGPVNTDDDSEHVPFRTTITSYDPTDFQITQSQQTALITSLPYLWGQFPVKITNPLGYTEILAFDQNTGILIQKTGPNNIHTCYEYDEVGLLKSETERCGTNGPLKTKITRMFNSDYVNYPQVKVVTKTSNPNGMETWALTDTLGRDVQTFTRHFEGGLTTKKTEYNELGRVYKVSKPYFPYETPLWTTNDYDTIGRLKNVNEELASLDGTNVVSGSKITFDYDGLSIKTEKLVLGKIRTHTESKNAIGKVSKVIDTNGNVISYYYDSEGNLIQTHDPNGNIIKSYYDLRNRKERVKDPNMGEWSYYYNGYGDLISQTDAKGKSIQMAYDKLGRLTKKSDELGSAYWTYVTTPGVGLGKLATEISSPDDRLKGSCATPEMPLLVGNRAVKTYKYTLYGELSQIDECIDGEIFTTNYEYDSLGRQEIVRYPTVNGSRLAVRNNYTSLGFLHYVSEDETDKPYWIIKSMDATGAITSEYTRNGVETVTKRNPSTGWLLESKVTSAAENNTVLQGFKYSYDEVGNLISRTQMDSHILLGSVETMEYDQLDRLHISRIKNSSSGYYSEKVMEYDKLGNILKKGQNVYSYSGCGDRPHAVCSVGGVTQFQYDGNGNMVSGDGRTVDYNVANKPTRIRKTIPVENAVTMVAEFIYGADGQRVVQSAGKSAGNMARTLYVGLGSTGRSLYERTEHNGTTEHVHFLYAGGMHGGNSFAVRVVKSNQNTGENTNTTHYNHFDHLGSITGTSDEMGRIKGPGTAGQNATMYSYDAWGSRRSPEGQAQNTNVYPLTVGHREFTGHETIPEVGLVNMNGRVYDPEIGRFLSPDPNVQLVRDLQSYNRYSYARNNPLKYTDPTGYFFGAQFDMFVNATLFIGGVAICAHTGGIACGIGVAIGGAVYNSASALNDDVSFQQVVLQLAVSGTIGYLTGGGKLDGGLSEALVRGALGSMTTSSIMSLANQRNPLGENLLQAGIMGAFNAGFTYAISNSNPVSQASEAKQQGGNDDGQYGRAYAGDGHDPISCGEQGIACGGKPNPKLDAFAKAGLYQKITITPNNGVAGVDDSVTVDLRTATKTTGREYLIGVLENPKTHALSYTNPVEGNSIATGGLKWADGRLKLVATIHTHPFDPLGAPPPTDPFTVMDVSNRSFPVYRWSQHLNNILVYTPPAGNSAATIRVLP